MINVISPRNKRLNSWAFFHRANDVIITDKKTTADSLQIDFYVQTTGTTPSLVPRSVTDSAVHQGTEDVAKSLGVPTKQVNVINRDNLSPNYIFPISNNIRWFFSLIEDVCVLTMMVQPINTVEFIFQGPLLLKEII